MYTVCHSLRCLITWSEVKLRDAELARVAGVCERQYHALAFCSWNSSKIPRRPMVRNIEVNPSHG